MAERFEDIAEEQGSKSAKGVLDNYLSKPERRRHRLVMTYSGCSSRDVQTLFYQITAILMSTVEPAIARVDGLPGSYSSLMSESRA